MGQNRFDMSPVARLDDALSTSTADTSALAKALSWTICFTLAPVVRQSA